MNEISRRDFIKATLAGSSALVAPTIINYLGQSSPSSDKEFLEIRDGNFYLGGEKFIMKGANYITRDHPWMMFKEYDPEQIDKELKIASDLGINTVRVPLSFPQSTGLGPDRKPLSDMELQKEYFNNFEDFLGIADSHGIKVMPITLDHPSPKLVKGRDYSVTRGYLEKWVPNFKDDERILAWDAQNEPDIWDMIDWSNYVADTLKELDPNHLVTIGLSDTHGAAEKETDEWKENFREEAIEHLPECIDHEDFYCFHYNFDVKVFRDAIDKIKEQTDKPIVLQEFGLPTTGEKWRRKWDQQWYYKEILKRVMEEDLSGVMFWELNDHPDEALDNPYADDEYYIGEMGILRDDYSKKPAARKVKQYYKWIL